MKAKIITALLFLAAAMNGFALNPENGMTTEMRTSKPYHFIHVKGEMNVKVLQQETPGVSVEGSGYQMMNTITILRNDTLFVYQTNIRKGEAKPFVTIGINDLSLLEVSGKTKVDCNGLINTDYLTIRAYDGAQIKVDVRALKVDSKVTGCSQIDLSGIAASNAQSIDGCGTINSGQLDVIDHKIIPLPVYSAEGL